MSRAAEALADIITDYMGSVDSIRYEVPEQHTEQVCAILRGRGFYAISISSSVFCKALDNGQSQRTKIKNPAKVWNT